MADFLCPYDAWEPWSVAVHQGEGPASVVLSPEDVEYLAPHLPTTGRVGFTADLSPTVRVRKRVRVRE